MQYMQRLPGWTVNLVLMREGKPFFAAVYEPLAQELFWAVAGQGAYLNDARLIPSTKTEPQLLLVTFNHPPFANKIEGLSGRIARSAEGLLRDFGTVRNYGPHALQIALVAAGRIDIFSRRDLTPTTGCLESSSLKRLVQRLLRPLATNGNGVQIACSWRRPGWPRTFFAV